MKHESADLQSHCAPEKIFPVLKLKNFLWMQASAVLSRKMQYCLLCFQASPCNLVNLAASKHIRHVISFILFNVTVMS